MITKKQVKDYCGDNNLTQPHFSGHDKTMYINGNNINYTQDQQLRAFATEIGYHFKLL